MENQKNNQEAFDFFKSKKAQFKLYFVLNPIISLFYQKKGLYLNLCFLTIIAIIAFIGIDIDMISYLFCFFVLVYFISLLLCDKYIESKKFILEMYDEISIELKKELRDGEKITLLNKQLDEIDIFLFSYGGIKKREDTLNYFCRNT